MKRAIKRYSQSQLLSVTVWSQEDWIRLLLQDPNIQPYNAQCLDLRGQLGSLETQVSPELLFKQLHLLSSCSDIVQASYGACCGALLCFTLFKVLYLCCYSSLLLHSDHLLSGRGSWSVCH